MAKYTFDQLGSERFEQLAQALLESLYRTSGSLSQFGPGKDGAREATWVQPPTHPNYVRPKNEDIDVDKHWVFQAKFHDVALRGWEQARTNVEGELNSELEKLIIKYHVPCHKYILLTNVPFSGVRHVGTRDRVNKIIHKWLGRVPEIEVWDATDLSRMLDSNRDVRTTFLGDILPGDLLRQMYEQQDMSNRKIRETAETYLRSIIRSERQAKAEEAGDESNLNLEKVYVDLDLKIEPSSLKGKEFPFMSDLIDCDRHLDSVDHDTTLPKTIDAVPASFVFLRAGYPSMLLKGGPGVGKSTITQFLTLYHAARLVRPEMVKELEKHLKLRGQSNLSFDHWSRLRFPIRIELRRYAQWLADPSKHGGSTFLSSYIAELISKNAASTNFGSDEVFSVVRENPTLLILDGLDEVPNAVARTQIFDELLIFLDRCQSQSSDVHVILSTRPQGYRGEFDGFDPIEWSVSELNKLDFFDYSERWLAERIVNPDERQDARMRLTNGMQSVAVQQMATTLLQATVMLTIVRQKHPIPHARHHLFEKYVEVIFKREESKQTVKEHFELLKRLHELVAYRLIQRMESAAKVQTLGGTEFANCIREVVEDHGSRGTLHERDELVATIQTSTKNRLCLLAGKGTSQDEVDFVIQPFREFFAASFLFRHGLGNPEKVYSSLVRRKNVWGNVLQFYCAFQTPAQQRNWIAEADGTDVKANGPNRLSELVRRRRALISILPEFDRPKNSYVERAFQNLLDYSTLWSWRYREDTPTLLASVGGTDSYAIACETFARMPPLDQDAMWVRLWLTSALATEGEKNQIALLLQSQLPTDNAPLALQVALEFSLDIDVSSVHNEIVARALNGWTRQRRVYRDKVLFSCFKGLSDARVIELVFRDGAGVSWQHHTVFKKPWINKLVEVLYRSKRVIEVGPIAILSTLSAANEESIQTLIDLSGELSSLGDKSPFTEYLHSLLLAIADPESVSCYQNALVLEEQAEIQADSPVSIKQQLGIGPDFFRSVEEWNAFQRKWRSEGDTMKKLITLLSDENGWLAVFFKPHAWPHLTTLLGPAIAEQLSNLVEPFDLDAVYEMLDNRMVHFESGFSLDTKLICEVVCEIAIDRCLSSAINYKKLAWALSVPEPEQQSAGAEPIVARLLNGNCDPTAAGFLISECSTFSDVDPAELYNAWKRCGEPELFGKLDGESNREVLEGLIGLPGEDGWIMAAQLLRSSRRRHLQKQNDLEGKIASRFCLHLLDLPSTSNWGREMLNTILRHVPSPEEIDVWLDERARTFVLDSDWIADRIGERLLILASTTVYQRTELLLSFGKLLEAKVPIPLRIRCAALDAYLRVEEVLMPPLADTDWIDEER